MKPFKTTALVLSGLMLATGPANAACNTGSCGPTLVKELYVNTGGQVYVELSDSLSPLDCTPVPGGYLTLDMSLPTSDEVYALLLSTHLQQSPIWVRLNNQSAGCTIAYVQSEK